MITRLDHIEIIVQDLDAYVRFFEALGFRVVARTTHHGHSVEMSLPGENQPVIELHRVMGEENPGINHIAFACDDVHETHRSLQEKGVTFTSSPLKIPSTGRLTVNLRDPGGLRVQLVDAERQMWLDDRKRR